MNKHAIVMILLYGSSAAISIFTFMYLFQIVIKMLS